MHSDIPHIHSPPTDKILRRSYQVAKLQDEQAGTFQLTGVVTSQQVAPVWITMKLGKQAAWMSTDWHTKQCEVWGSCGSDREKLYILLCEALQPGRF